MWLGVLVGTLGVAGCTAGSATEAPTTPARSSTTSTPATPEPSPTLPSAPTSSAAPTSGPDQDVTKPPARPEALDGPATEDNAIAVAKYFTALYTYIVATGDFTEWDALSGPECRFCANGRESARDLHSAGNHGTGGAVDIGFGSAAAQDDGTFVASVQFTEYPSQTVDATGAIVEDFPETNRLMATMLLSRTASGWKVNGVQIDEFGQSE